MSEPTVIADSLDEPSREVELTKPELSARVVRSLVLYFDTRFSPEETDQILKKTGLSRSYLEDEYNWVSMAYRDLLIHAMTEYAEDPKFAYLAGRHTATKEAIGTAYSILASFSRPKTVYKKMLELVPQANKVGSFKVLELNDSSLSLIYQPVSEEYWDEGPGAEFRLGQLIAWPRLCNLPDASAEVKVIKVDGRRAYHYSFTWETYPRFIEPLIGAVAGLGVGWHVENSYTDLSRYWVLVGATLIGLVLGLLVNAHRQNRHLSRSIIQQQDGLFRSERAIQQRYNELYENHVEIQALNEELKENYRRLQVALEENKRLNADLNHRVLDLEAANGELEILRGSLEGEVERKTAELKAKNAELEVKNTKLHELDQVKTRFFNRINHELRTPLTLILTPIQAILTDPVHDLPRGHRQLLKTMQSNAFRLLKLINSLLDLARGADATIRLRYEEVDINEFVRSLVEDVRPTTVQHGLSLNAEFDPKLGAVHVDRGRMEEILFNLLSNAVKFTRKNGTVSVQTEMTDTGLAIRVSDQGPGIAEERIPRLFDHFSDVGTEVERGYGGTGIGLSIVRELTELHNGRILVDSEVGKGTTFTVALPLGESTVRREVEERRHEKVQVPLPRRREETQHRATEVIVNAHEINMSDFRGLEQDKILGPQPIDPDKKTILVVDDHPEVLHLLVGLLREQYNVVTSDNGLDGEAAARAILPDLVLSDVMMEKGGGFRLCEELRADPKTADIPVVMMSAKDDAAAGIARGADDYLTKPFDIFELRARISMHLEKRELLGALRQKNKELAEKNVVIEELSRRDALTTLYNRRHMSEMGQASFQNALVHGQPLACLMVDIDHFKNFNTRFGHAGGDEVLIEVSRFLEAYFGDVGTVSRHGGEEFLILLPGYELELAGKLAGDFVTKVRDRAFGGKGQYHITLSIGVASVPEVLAERYDQLVDAADVALFKAKETRDCVVAAASDVSKGLRAAQVS